MLHIVINFVAGWRYSIFLRLKMQDSIKFIAFSDLRDVVHSVRDPNPFKMQSCLLHVIKIALCLA